MFYGLYNTYILLILQYAYQKKSQEVENIKLFLASIFKSICAQCTYLYRFVNAYVVLPESKAS